MDCRRWLRRLCSYRRWVLHHDLGTYLQVKIHWTWQHLLLAKGLHKMSKQVNTEQNVALHLCKVQGFSINPLAWTDGVITAQTRSSSSSSSSPPSKPQSSSSSAPSSSPSSASSSVSSSSMARPAHQPHYSVSHMISTQSDNQSMTPFPANQGLIRCLTLIV